jgi:hypothetical protein
MNKLSFISYWILAWYILYIFKITKYNPKIWLILVLIGMSLLSLIILYSGNYNAFIISILMIIVIKIIPLWTIRHTKIRLRDFYAGLVLFIIYYMWLLYNDTNIYVIYEKLINNYINDTI